MNYLACMVTGAENEYRARAKIKDIAPTAEIMVPRVHHREVKNGKVKVRSERMLPGYLIIGTEEPLDAFQLKSFIKVVGRISQGEIDAIKAQETQEKGIIEVGTRIMIIDGPFQGCRGLVERVNEDETVYCIFSFQGMDLDATLKPELVTVER